jgi:predicted RNase H-like HicB family nuclease
MKKILTDSSELLDQYTYRVRWSKEDQGFIAICDEFPSLSAFLDTPEKDLAYTYIRELVGSILEDMRENGEEIPKPRRQGN